MIQVRYDLEAHAVYAKLRQAKGRIKTREIDDVRLVDYDETGAAVGVELLFVSRGVDLRGLPEAERIAEALVSAACSVGLAPSSRGKQ